MPTKITQQETQKIPKLRFSDFFDEWEEKELGEVATFLKGKGISKSDIVENGRNKCICYGELYTRYGEVIKEVKSKTNISKDESLLSKKGDVLIPSSGETALDIATVSCVKEDNILLGGDLNIMRPKEDQDGDFLAYCLSNFHDRNIAKIAQGYSVVHLYKFHLKTLKINIPTFLEQQKISEFLRTTVDWVENLREQKESLKFYKKGIIQGIFSQKVRFKNNHGKNFPHWEKKMLGEIGDKKSSDVSANSLENNNGEYKIYGASGFIKKISFYKEENPYVSIVKDGAGVGRILLCDPKTSVLGTLDIIKPQKDVSLYFLYLLLSGINFTKYVTGATIPHIYFKDYKKENFLIPSFPEQQKITEFLTSIDNLIKLKQQQITQAESWRKGLMQGLFV